jgi:hypothetical protein
LVKLGNLKMGEVESLSFNTPTLWENIGFYN